MVFSEISRDLSELNTSVPSSFGCIHSVIQCLRHRLLLEKIWVKGSENMVEVILAVMIAVVIVLSTQQLELVLNG